MAETKKAAISVPQGTFMQLRVHQHAGRATLLVLYFAFLMFLFWPVYVVGPAGAAGLSFGFGDGRDVVSGMIVGVDQTNPDSLVQAHVNNVDYVVGIAVNQASSSVVLDNYDSVHVATEGTTGVFVSDLSGDIAKGDLIVVSTIGGVGQKKDPSYDGQKIIGVAKGDFNEQSPGAEQTSLENSGEVHIGIVDAEVLVGEPAAGQDDEGGDNVLIRIGRRVAGKPVSLSQVLVTASVITATFIISGALLFGSLRGSFTSIGRNPLSANTIYHGMIRASLIALSVMMLGILAGYVVLII